MGAKQDRDIKLENIDLIKALLQAMNPVLFEDFLNRCETGLGVGRKLAQTVVKDLSCQGGVTIVDSIIKCSSSPAHNSLPQKEDTMVVNINPPPLSPKKSKMDEMNMVLGAKSTGKEQKKAGKAKDSKKGK